MKELLDSLFYEYPDDVKEAFTECTIQIFNEYTSHKYDYTKKDIIDIDVYDGYIFYVKLDVFSAKLFKEGRASLTEGVHTFFTKECNTMNKFRSLFESKLVSIKMEKLLQ